MRFLWQAWTSFDLLELIERLESGRSFDMRFVCRVGPIHCLALRHLKLSREVLKCYLEVDGVLNLARLPCISLQSLLLCAEVRVDG